MKSVYWPDALDDHGSFVGSATGFIEWMMAFKESIIRSHHHIGNILCAVIDDAAEVESYFSATASIRNQAGVAEDLIATGRYLDRFERRDGIWKIAGRLTIYDWHRSFTDSHEHEKTRFGTQAQRGAYQPHDASYGFFSARWHKQAAGSDAAS